VTQRRHRLATVLACGWLATVGDAAATTTFVVNSTADAVDALPGNGICATADGICTLRAAVQEAQAVFDDYRIQLPAGTYLLTIPGVGESAGATGDLNLANRIVTFTGAGAQATIIDANGIDRALTGFSARVLMYDLTVRNGASGGFGGCFSFLAGFLILERVVVRGCRAGSSAAGGAIALSGSEGGLIPGSVRLINSVVADNVAQKGGALYLGGDTQSWIEHSTVSGNSAEAGGAVYVLGMGSNIGPTLVSVVDSTLATNTASGAGGALFVGHLARASLTRSMISGNTAAWGGGIAVTTPVPADPPFPLFPNPLVLRVDQTTIAGNVATGAAGGGGIYFSGPVVEPPIADIANSTFSANEAQAGGGAALMAASGKLKVTNVTIAWNSGAFGGGVQSLAAASVLLANTIAAHNGSTNCAADGPLVDMGHNLEFPGVSCGFTHAGSRHADPRLGPLGNYGGPTSTHPLAAGSAAIDAGNATTCAAPPISGVDQRNAVRLADPPCDIGAYESEPAGPPFTDNPLIPGVTPVRAVHLTELRWRIDALRSRFGLQPVAWMDAQLAGRVVSIGHVQQLRDALVAAYDAAIAAGVNISGPSFADDPVLPRQTTIRAAHIQELRAAVRALEGV
jgi:CSLREA domain-containing protein